MPGILITLALLTCRRHARQLHRELRCFTQTPAFPGSAQQLDKRCTCPVREAVPTE